MDKKPAQKTPGTMQKNPQQKNPQQPQQPSQGNKINPAQQKKPGSNW